MNETAEEAQQKRYDACAHIPFRSGNQICACEVLDELQSALAAEKEARQTAERRIVTLAADKAGDCDEHAYSGHRPCPWCTLATSEAARQEAEQRTREVEDYGRELERIAAERQETIQGRLATARAEGRRLLGVFVAFHDGNQTTIGESDLAEARALAAAESGKAEPDELTRVQGKE